MELIEEIEKARKQWMNTDNKADAEYWWDEYQRLLGELDAATGDRAEP